AYLRLPRVYICISAVIFKAKLPLLDPCVKLQCSNVGADVWLKVAQCYPVLN
ncbi:unnamed protein product, partial [Allacma fusca]